MPSARALLSLLALLGLGVLVGSATSPEGSGAPSTLQASGEEAPSEGLAVLRDGRVRGMTLSTPTWGWEWGTEAMDSSLRELAGLGVSWVAIHPYGGIREDGSVRLRPIDPAAPPDWLARPVREAHALGMQVMIKPHIAYWGTSWDWRGAIEFETDAQRARFWADYSAFIVTLAEASAGADAFVVGTELDRLLADEAEWRALIGKVRAVYDGPITYAANWTDYQRVPFWDALDVIGVQAYFPLMQRAPGGVPTDRELDAGWDAALAPVVALAERLEKPVVFTELGYNRSDRAPVEPWAYATGGNDAEAIQAACVRAAIRAMDRHEAVLGGFFWKWFPGPATPRDFDASAPYLRDILADTWGRSLATLRP